MSERAGPFLTRREALKFSEAACRHEARRQSRTYPIPWTRVVGVGPSDMQTHPGRYSTYHLTEVRKLRTREGEFYFELTPRMLEAEAGKTETVDGEVVEVRRRGVQIDDSEFEIVEGVRTR